MQSLFKNIAKNVVGGSIGGKIRSVDRFVSHNKKVFSRPTLGPKNNKIILLEFNSMASGIISYSYLAEVLSKKHNSHIYAYVPTEQMGRRFRRKSINFVSPMTLSASVYKSFGVEEIVIPKLDASQGNRAEKLSQQIMKSLSTRGDVEDITVDEVHIGDLIYDTYLQQYQVPTIDLDSESFAESLLSSIRNFVFWKDYFKNNEICAVNVSHCVYIEAIPLRLAVEQDKPAYQTNASHVYRLSKDNLFAYGDFKFYKEVFRLLPDDKKQLGIKAAKDRVQRRFGGEAGIDVSHLTQSAWAEGMSNRLLRRSTKTKVLIAVHDFVDSPHSFGKNLFPDFYEWVDFLGQVARVTDYDWYIKLHPAHVQGTKWPVEEHILPKYPEFTVIPLDSSHRQLIAEGIDVALTTYGTIGFEYALLGIPVVNASMNNPHVAYNFNIHPRSIEEYEEILQNLDKLNIDIDKEEIFEYYYMRNIYNTSDWLLGDRARQVESIATPSGHSPLDGQTLMNEQFGSYEKQFTSAMYDYWIDSCYSERRHEEILGVLENFSESKDFRLDRRHIRKTL